VDGRAGVRSLPGAAPAPDEPGQPPQRRRAEDARHRPGPDEEPRLLLLDEPVEGLAPLVVRDLIEVLREIRAGGVIILLADQNLKFCRKLADRGYIMEKGLIQHAGAMEVIWQNEEVVRQYLAL
jgi:ABC-type lipopolysaccharide export system ATPase subunit